MIPESRPTVRVQPATPAGTTLVIGLGNPILGDDGVGWRVAEQVRERLAIVGEAASSRAEIDCASLGGLALMERMLGYERAVLIDSIQSGVEPVGSVRTCRLEELPNPSAGYSASAHDATLLTALEVARAVGAAVPVRVDVVAIESQRSFEFSDRLTARVAASVPLATAAVMDILNQEVT